MEVRVENVALARHAIDTPPQGIYETYKCPICREDTHIRLVGCVETNDRTSLESAFCVKCEHRFHRKFPNADWLKEYYERLYESERGGVLEARSQPVERAGVYRRTRSAIGSLVRYGLMGGTPNRIGDFCTGVTKGDNRYYSVRPDIRKVLEVGCGNGDNLKYFSDAGYETWGTESNPGRVIACRKRGLNAYLTGVGFPDEVREVAPFDFIYSTHVLEHIIDVGGHVSELSALVKPGGFVYVETPDLSGESVIYQTHTIFHVHTFSLSSMLSLLGTHGFAPVRVHVDGNLQVLAQKSVGSDHVHVDLKGALYSDSSEQYLRELLAQSPGRFAIQWDHYRMKIEKFTSGEVIYERGLGAFQVAPGPNQHHLICEVPEQSEAPVYPVHFIYDGEDPPIWYKN